MENDVPERQKLEDRRKKTYTLRRAILDFGMGVIIFVIGIVLLLAPVLKLALSVDGVARYIFAGLFLVYGGFRIYRGSRKNYFD
jgi:uncharacterized membrane protein